MKPSFIDGIDMLFTSPLWLLALLPWAAVAVWLLIGQRRDVNVPFLWLWRGPLARPNRARSFRRPPVWLIAILLCILLAIVASAKPKFTFPNASDDAPVHIMVDTGLTMPPQRYRELGRQVGDILLETLGDGPVELEAITTRQIISTRRGRLADAIAALPPTALDTRPMLASAVAQTAQRAPWTLVLTDQSIDPSNASIIRIAPESPLENISITALAASDAVHPQLMISIRNQSSHQEGELVIRADSDELRRSIQLPARGLRENYFVDLDTMPGTIVAQLNPSDDIPADNVAWLTRETDWPTIEVRAGVSVALTRMIDTYRRLRPAAAGSPRVIIVHDPADLPPDDPAVVVVAEDARTVAVSGGVSMLTHPLTAGLTSMSLEESAESAPPEGWTPVLTAGDRTLVAVRDASPRRVWVGIPSRAWSQSSEFVIFWTNTLTWLAGGGQAYASHPPMRLPDAWRAIEPSNRPDQTPVALWPGLYQRNDGALRAVIAPDVDLTEASATDWRPRLRAAALNHRSGYFNAAPFTLILSLTCLLLAAFTWPTSRGDAGRSAKV